MTWWQRLVSSHPSPAGGSGEDIHYGRSLKGLAARLKKLPHPRLLDLGHTCGPNIDFFVQLGCKVHVDDYATSLLERPQPAPAETEAKATRKDQAKGFPAGKKKVAPAVHIPPVKYQ